MANGKLYGSVLWFNAAKGFGFIKGQDGREHFVHYSSIMADGYRKLNEGDEVEFVLDVGENKRVQAKQVKLVS